MLIDDLREARSVLWPTSCAGCSAPDIGVCQACRSLFEGTTTGSLDGVPLVTATRYEGAVRGVVLAAKEHGRQDALGVLAGSLERLIAEVAATRAESGSTVTVTVPSSRSGFQRRGFLPMRVLARRAALAPVELRLRSRGQQKTRERADRLLASRQSLHVATRDVATLCGASCVVVDDVVTTGATALDAVRAVREAGGTVEAVVAIAATPLRGARGAIRSELS